MGYSMVDIYHPKDILKPSPTWPDWLKREFLEAEDNGHVGMELLSETGQVRVWFILLKPWDRLPVHKHVLNYVWINSLSHRFFPPQTPISSAISASAPSQPPRLSGDHRMSVVS